VILGFGQSFTSRAIMEKEGLIVLFVEPSRADRDKEIAQLQG
jgi:hypothetical protein